VSAVSPGPSEIIFPSIFRTKKNSPWAQQRDPSVFFIVYVNLLRNTWTFRTSCLFVELVVDVEEEKGPAECHGSLVDGVSDDQCVQEDLCHHQTLKENIKKLNPERNFFSMSLSFYLRLTYLFCFELLAFFDVLNLSLIGLKQFSQPRPFQKGSLNGSLNPPIQNNFFFCSSIEI